MLLFAFPGTGKTSLAEEYDNVLDLELAEIKYDNSGYEHLSMEERKSLKRPIKDKHYRSRYVEKAMEAHDEGKLVLVALNFFFRIMWELYKRQEFDYHIILPQHGLRNEYVERYRSRGSNAIFIGEVMLVWTPTILFFSTIFYFFPEKISYLGTGQTLSTFLSTHYPQWLGTKE